MWIDKIEANHEYRKRNVSFAQSISIKSLLRAFVGRKWVFFNYHLLLQPAEQCSRRICTFFFKHSSLYFSKMCLEVIIIATLITESFSSHQLLSSSSSAWMNLCLRLLLWNIITTDPLCKPAACHDMMMMISGAPELVSKAALAALFFRSTRRDVAWS